MGKESFIGGDYIETTGGSSKTYAGKNIENSSLGNQFTQNGLDSGVTYGTNEEAPTIGGSTVIDAYFAKIDNDLYQKINWAGVEDEIYIVVKTQGLSGKNIEINILDRDGVITKDEYSPLAVLQDNMDKKGEFITKVRDDGFAIFKLEMKPSKNENDIKIWRDKIAATKDKKAKLCILVDAHSRNPDLKVNYLGKNSESDKSSQKADKHNYWLDENGKWFELRRKSPVIIIDPGHGYTKGNTGAVSWIYTYKLKGKDGKEVLDEKKQPKTDKADVIKLPQYVIDTPSAWIVSVKEDPQRSERFLVYDVSAKLKKKLDDNGYKTFITRERGPIVGSDNGETRKKRIDLAKNNKAEYFISIHADGANGYTSTGSHVIYPDSDNTECIELAKDIFTTYNVVPVESNSPKIDVRGLQVLSQIQNTTKRKILVELGFVTSPKDSKALFSGIDTIAKQLYDGLIININKNF
ncbi:N-acetylmuramoyl-L-alanine amidase [Chryseobacterium sp. MOF25P]|uniref:N-acetylmuramoyl-L-alanine amidase n=1 Tax=unclassified Chryseobacterium TaxID=2593645 RepID=UPI00080535F6|nr:MULTISPECIES: N-acetylmuramoyl-L-alanine amidase [unclassified Chryseobacterium]OBW41373.1 N-acetylmuramoyl-L-alanine amidase [Chryseobacterium sp. MOF25P]OBW43771.1 N-acetylmuramoyl-L-alanine amidase [Chryseobacterium sp. BGARF1]